MKVTYSLLLHIERDQTDPASHGWAGGDFEQQLTKKRALRRLVEVAEPCHSGDEAYLCILQAKAEKEAEALVEETKPKINPKINTLNIPTYEFRSAIVVHADLRVIGIGFLYSVHSMQNSAVFMRGQRCFALSVCRGYRMIIASSEPLVSEVGLVVTKTNFRMWVPGSSWPL